MVATLETPKATTSPDLEPLLVRIRSLEAERPATAVEIRSDNERWESHALRIAKDLAFSRQLGGEHEKNRLEAAQELHQSQRPTVKFSASTRRSWCLRCLALEPEIRTALAATFAEYTELVEARRTACTSMTEAKRFTKLDAGRTTLQAFIQECSAHRVELSELAPGKLVSAVADLNATIGKLRALGDTGICGPAVEALLNKLILERDRLEQALQSEPWPALETLKVKL